MKVNILLTCVNSQVAPSIIKLIRDHPLFDIDIMGIDTKDYHDCISTPFLSDYYPVPMGDNELYIPQIFQIVNEKEINVILVGSDEEVLALSNQKKELLQRHNCHVCSSNYEISKLASDKYQLMMALKNAGIPIAQVYPLQNIPDLYDNAKKLGYPGKKIIIKPRFGRGSKGFRVITPDYNKYNQFYLGESLYISLDELKIIFSKNPEKLANYLLMEYLPGDKYSSDCLVANGEIISMIIRNNGIKPKISPPTQIADIVFDRDIRDYVTKIVNYLMFDYFIQIEVGRDDKGQPLLIEANTRMDATLPITTGLGINFYHELITYAITGKYEKNIPDYSDFERKIRFIRYWEHYFKN